jgi:hypothetical protein
VLIVGTDPTIVETELLAGLLACPGCSLALRPWGHGIEREVRLLGGIERRRPRRSICRPCLATHMLVPEDTLLRRRDGAEVIGAALTAKANGSGHRRIARTLGRSVSVVRGWLRRFSAMAAGLRELFTRWASALDPGHDRLSSGGSAFFDAVEALGVLEMVSVRRFGPRPPWVLASVVSGGGLLCNTRSLYRQPV